MSHKDALKLLFPLPLEGVLDQDIELEGAYLDAAQASAGELLTEAFADTAAALIGSWERVTGITWPDGPPPLQARQSAVVGKLQSVGGLSAAYFIGLAAAFGWTITITEMQPFMAGISRAGDTIYPAAICFAWKVSGAGTIYKFTAGQSAAGEALQWWGANTGLESLLNGLKPAHTYIIFNYQLGG